MEGRRLLSTVLNATGISGESLDVEMQKVMSASNVSEETLTLEQLREMLASYLQDVLLEAKESFEDDTKSA